MPLLYFCGLEESYEGEGFDRENLLLPQSHIDLYKEIIGLTKNVALVTFSGSAIDLTFAPEARAILHMYLCGEACGQACAALISGQKNPCGKLAESWPYKVEVGAPHSSYDIPYEEGVLAGYRWYETKKQPVQYEFGFGLSYSSFEYSELKVSGPSRGSGTTEALEGPALFHISLSVQNTGTVDGSEVVQLYVKNPECDPEISRPVMELRAFQKIFLKTGEKKTITFTLDQRAFSVYSTKKKCFAPVKGNYEICIGASLKDIRLSAPVKIEGEEIEALVNSDALEKKDIFAEHLRHKKGEFTLTDSLKEMAEESKYVNRLLKLYRMLLILTSRSKSKDDPAVKINITGIEENPLESLISISGGRITEKRARKIVSFANR